MITRLFVLILLSAATVSAETSKKAIAIRLLQPPGSLEIRNKSHSDISLRGRLLVERQWNGSWTLTPAVFQVIDSCGVQDAPDCVTLPAHGTITPVRWNGYTCSGQCTRSCRANYDSAPGIFRVTVQTCDAAQSFTSESFELKESRPVPGSGSRGL